METITKIKTHADKLRALQGRIGRRRDEARALGEQIARLEREISQDYEDLKDWTMTQEELVRDYTPRDLGKN